MSVSRRELLRASCLVPLGAGAVLVVTRLADVVRSTAPAVRPAAAGTSATRCAVCGASGHAMLDPDCPAARKVI